MVDIQIRKGSKHTKPFEYFCKHCRQLRWCCAQIDSCGNCGSEDIIKAEPGKLNKQALKVENGEAQEKD